MKQKFFYIANSRIPTEKAHGIQIMKMCEAFAELGMEVELVVPFRKNKIEINPFDFYNVKNIFKITTIRNPDYIRYGKFGYYFSSLIFVIKVWLKLGSQFQSRIYTRDPIMGILFKNHSLELHDFPSNPNFIYSWLIKRALFYIVKTKSLKDKLISLDIKDSKIEIIFNGVDVSIFNSKATKGEAREKTHLPKDKNIVLYSGTFYIHDWKGVSILLEAVEEFPDNILTILIGGTKEDAQKINSKYLNKKVLAFERISNYEIPLFLRAADVLILPNKKGNVTSEFYTSPLKLFEYMASKTPIVASDLPSIKEVVTEEEVTFFEANNPLSLTKSINDIFNNFEIVNKKAEKAFQKVQYYSWVNQAKKILKFVESNV